MSELVTIPPGALDEIARTLDITDHRTGARTRWAPNEEQRCLWERGYEHPYVYALKPRQVGISTSTVLDDVVFTVVNSARGHPVETWLVWDTDTKARAKLDLAEDFAHQMRVPFTRRDNSLLFAVDGSARPSKISALTAGGRRAGAGLTAHRLHLSELPAWQDASETFNSLLQCLVLDGRAVIETTMLLGQELPKRLWYEPNEWRQVFFSVEMHDEYRRDAALFRPDHPDLPEEDLRALGFTDVAVMSFIQWAFENKCDGDLIKLGREYPQTPEQAFASAEGRWVRVTPRVVEHRAHRIEGSHLALRVFVEPEDTSGQCVIAVDTAGGMGRDRSAVVVLDRRDRRLVASYADETCTVEELVRVAREAQQLYTSTWEPPAWQAGRPSRTMRPVALIEDNGLGLATVQYAEKLGVVFRPVRQVEGTTYACMLRAKRAIEAGEVYGPYELAEECDECHVLDGKFKGHKDMLVSVGMAIADIEATPYRALDVEPEDTEVFRYRSPRRRR